MRKSKKVYFAFVLMACVEALKNICRFSVLRLTDALCSSKICGLIFGGVPEGAKGADCKSAGSTFGGSNPPPSTRSGNSSGGRASAFQAEGREFESRCPLTLFSRCSSGVERFLGKEEVTGSIPVIGSKLKGKKKEEVVK